jgi:excinuclease UvrABC helicase subunit UvrB
MIQIGIELNKDLFDVVLGIELYEDVLEVDEVDVVEILLIVVVVVAFVVN